jgi:hypothetical protein
MVRELTDELLANHAGGPEDADVDALCCHGVRSVTPKKKPAALLSEGPAGGCASSVCVSGYEHTTTGLRIRFVRFRQMTCWMVCVTIARV